MFVTTKPTREQQLGNSAGANNYERQTRPVPTATVPFTTLLVEVLTSIRISSSLAIGVAAPIRPGDTKVPGALVPKLFWQHIVKVPRQDRINEEVNEHH